MPTSNAPVKSYRGTYNVTDGPTIDRLVDSLKYRRNHEISVSVRFTLGQNGNRSSHLGQISMVSFRGCSYSDKAIVDITFDGPWGSISGWYNTETRQGVFRA